MGTQILRSEGHGYQIARQHRALPTFTQRIDGTLRKKDGTERESGGK